jgi:hypothetical protein
MARLIQRGGLENDPLRHPIEALSLHLGAQHDLMRDLVTRLNAVQTPITSDEIQALNRAAARHAMSELTYAVKALVKQQFWRLSTTVGAAALVGLVLISGGMGAVAMWATTPALTILNQVDGSQIAYYFVRHLRNRPTRRRTKPQQESTERRDSLLPGKKYA